MNPSNTGLAGVGVSPAGEVGKPDESILARRDWIVLVVASGVVFGLVVLRPVLPLVGAWSDRIGPVADKLQVFASIFLGIFVEAVPFLLIGVLASAVIQVFVTDAVLARFVPRGRLAAAAVGGALGLIFPVCDCGAIPVSRRLLAKGAPIPLAIAFMLAAPVLNPVVIIATWIAFGGLSPGLALARFGSVYVVAVLVALIFGWQRTPGELVPPGAFHGSVDHSDDLASGTDGWFTALARHASEEFFEMGRFLVVGAALAASMQTVVPRALLLSVGKDPLLSIAAMMVLAVLLSVCSTVDAFVALSFVGTFTPGALVAFLAFGPMVDFKSSLMYTTTLRRPAVLLLVVLCAQFVFLVAAWLNLFVRW